MKWLLIFPLFALTMPAAAQETLYVATPTPTVMRIINRSGQSVEVVDGMYHLATVMNGETVVVEMRNDPQARAVTVRCFDWVRTTETMRFINSGYELTIDTRRLWLTLWVPK
jgi:hypothetical protein